MASTHRNLTVTVGLCLIFGLPGTTQGLEYTFTTVAHTGGQFSSFGEPMAPSVNDQGTVAFRGIRSSGGEGIYTGNGGPLATIAETTGQYPSAVFGWSVS